MNKKTSQNASLQRKAGAILSYVSIAVNTVIELLYTPFLISKLGQSEYGLYSLVASIIGYLTILDLGFGNAIIVFGSKYHAKQEYEKEQQLHGMFKRIYFIIGVIAAIIGIILAFNTGSIFSATMTDTDLEKMKIMILILSFNLFLTFTFNIYSAIITANEQFLFQKIISILGTIIRPLLMIPMLLIGYKSIALCIIITIVNFAILIANYVFCKKKLKIIIKFKGFNKKILKKVFSFSFYLFLCSIVDKINWSADQTILGISCGTIAVSVYSAASQINQMFISLSTAISGVLLPKMSKMIARKASIDEVSEEFIKVGRIQYYVVFLAASGLIIFGKQFINLWLGKGFEQTYYITLILVLPICFPLIQNLGLSIMQAMNKYKFKAITTSIMAVFNIVISILLAQKYGAVGAAIGTAIALIICNIIIINIYYAKNLHLNIKSFWINILIMTFKFLLPVLVVICILPMIELNSWPMLLSAITLYTIIYCVYAYFICMNRYERSLIKKVITKLRTK